MPRPVRPIRIEGDIAYVPLTKGYEAIIDAEDVPKVEGRNWCADVRKGFVYACWTNWRTKEKIYLHRFLMPSEYVAEVVDHEDRNTLDNRKFNLRVANKSTNAANSKTRKDNSSGYKGVCRARSGRWFAQIQKEGTYEYLGMFDCPTKAHEAYKQAALKYHGEFARFE